MSRTRIVLPAIVHVPSTIVPQVFSVGGSTVTQNFFGSLSAGRANSDCIVLDMDSSVSPTHGEQEMSVWNGHCACACYHPLFVFNQFGDLERCALRPGSVHSADGWDGVLKRRPSFGLSELLVAIHTSRQSCSKAGKARIFALVLESSRESRLITER
jgi:hypothetical protein